MVEILLQNIPVKVRIFLTSLIWEGVPEVTQSLVIIVDDPDAPDPKAPKMTWVNWVVYNIPPEANGLPEDASSAMLPQGTEQGQQV